VVQTVSVNSLETRDASLVADVCVRSGSDVQDCRGQCAVYGAIGPWKLLRGFTLTTARQQNDFQILPRGPCVLAHLILLQGVGLKSAGTLQTLLPAHALVR